MTLRTFIYITLFVLITGCAPKSLEPVTLQDAVRLSFSAPSAKSVSIAGSFNHWDPQINALTGPDGNGVWTIVLPLPPGRYEYRFIVNGNDWVLDPSAPSEDDGLGERNSLFFVQPSGK